MKQIKMRFKILYFWLTEALGQVHKKNQMNNKIAVFITIVP